MIWKMLRVAEQAWRKPNAPELLPLVASGPCVRMERYAGQEVRPATELSAREERRLILFTHLLTESQATTGLHYLGDEAVDLLPEVLKKIESCLYIT